jgi:hypothetical protein
VATVEDEKTQPEDQPKWAPTEQTATPLPSGESVSPMPILPDADELWDAYIQLLEFPDYYPEALRDATETLMGQIFRQYPTMDRLVEGCLYLIGGLRPSVVVVVERGLRWDKTREAVGRFISDFVHYNCVDVPLVRTGYSPEVRTDVARQIVDIIRKSVTWEKFIVAGQDAVVASRTRTALLREELTNYQLRAKLVSCKCDELGHGPLTVDQLRERAVEPIPQQPVTRVADRDARVSAYLASLRRPNQPDFNLNQFWTAAGVHESDGRKWKRDAAGVRPLTGERIERALGWSREEFVRNLKNKGG